MIRAAIVGLGFWGRTLVNSVQGKSDRIRFTGAQTRTPAKAESYCRDNGLTLYSDFDAILADQAIDAVVLATPHSEHAGQVIKAAAAGKHIYIEKPFTLEVASTDPALAAVAKAGVVLAVGYQRRFAASVGEIRTRIREGRLGTLVHCECEITAHAGLTTPKESWRSNPSETPAGAMTGLGVHVIDNMIDLIGEIDEVFCLNVRRAAAHADDTTSVLLSFKNGVTGSLFCSLATSPSYRVAVFGSKGYAEASRPMLDMLRIAPIPAGPPGTPPPQPELIENKAVDLVRSALEAFAGAVGGGAPYPVTPAQIRHGVAVLEAVVRSAKTRQLVKVG